MKLEIVIPTYNRPLCIEKNLTHLKKYLGIYDFGIYIIDSSQNDETKRIIEKFPFVRYERLNSTINIDVKTVKCLKNAKADFVMLCGDGYSPNIDEIFQIIDFDKSVGIYVLYDERWSKKRTKYVKSLKNNIYDSKSDFFVDHFGMLTLYGGSIVNKHILEKIDENYIINKYAGNYFIYPCLLAEYSFGIYKAFVSNFLEVISDKKYPGWITSKEAVRVWAKSFCISVDSLTNIFTKNEIKAIIRNNFIENDFFTAKGLVWLRTTDNFSISIYKQYKVELKRVLSCNRMIAIVIALIPKWVLSAIRNLYKKFKRSEKI